MTSALAVATAALAAFGALAFERAGVYELHFSARRVSVVLPALMALSIASWLGLHDGRACIKAVTLACVAVSAATDLQTGYVFDRVTLGAVATSLLIAVAAQGFLAALAGCAVGGGLPLVAYAATGGRGVGLGDVKLAAAIGAGLGVIGVIAALRVAVVCAGAAALALWCFGRVDRRSALPFAPFLALGATYGAVTCG